MLSPQLHANLIDLICDWAERNDLDPDDVVAALAVVGRDIKTAFEVLKESGLVPDDLPFNKSELELPPKSKPFDPALATQMLDEAYEAGRKRIIKMADDLKEFVPVEDGETKWFPTKGGCLTATELRILADELDKRNSKYIQDLQENLKPEPKGTK